MQFSLTLFLAALATVVTADNTITFESQDQLDRTVYFYNNPGHEHLEPVRVEGYDDVEVEIPYGWQGNFFSVLDGEPFEPGMLGEVCFNCWDGLTFFDVSAIVQPDDHVGVKQIWPASSSEPSSGCDIFPCAFAYYKWNDDWQTKATHETDLIVSLGTDMGLASRSVAPRAEHDAQYPVFAHDAVMGSAARPIWRH